MRRVLLSFALIGPVGCFALKLDEFPAPRCASQMDCDYLNRAERIEAAACMRYQCAMQERVCVLAPRDDDGDGDPSPACGGRDCDDANALRVGNPANPRSREVCDGIDNNCNEIIDEGALLRGPARAVVSGGAAATTLVSAERISGGMEVLVGAQSALGVASSGMVLPLQYRSQLRQADRLDQQDNACPVIDSSGNFAAGRCSFQEAALAPMDPSRWFLLTVSASSCMQGQLRAGWFDATRAVVLAQPASNIAVGIDVSQSVSCTGARRMPFVAGATGVSLASIVAEGAPSRALGAWLARARNVAGCGMSSNVEAMGLWLASTRLQDSTLVSGVRGTNDGSPVVLGDDGGVWRARGVGAGGCVLGRLRLGRGRASGAGDPRVRRARRLAGRVTHGLRAHRPLDDRGGRGGDRAGALDGWRRRARRRLERRLRRRGSPVVLPSFSGSHQPAGVARE
jgi:hypothetical protein